MPEQTISPGVFTEERDQTFLQQGVQEIGGAFVGPTQKGPAFQPVEVDSPQEYEEQFGNQGLYMDYSTRNYLRDASTATVVRLLGEDGYDSEAVEIQLPSGELSKRPFQVSKAEFSFDTDIELDETVEAKVCVRGRQRRSSSTEVLNYDLKIHEYVDGEYNGTVIEETGLDLDCYTGTFTPISNDYTPVHYEVEVERVDGQTDTVESPTVQLQGFFLDTVDYNWIAGKEKGEDEIASLTGTVDNINGSNYDVEVYEVINGSLQDDAVASDSFSDNVFRLAWVHNGRASDRLTYVVKATNAAPDGEEVESVPDDVSPAIDVISRPEVNGFQILDVNWNFVEGEKVDYREKLQVDAEASAPVNSNELSVDDGNNQTSISVQDVSGDPNDSSVYIEYSVGDSGIDLSRENVISYILKLSEVSNPTSSEERTEESPEVEVDGGVFQIEELETDFAEGDEVGPSERSGVSFTVVNENGPVTPFDYEIYEIIDGSKQNTPLETGTDISNGTVSLGLTHSASTFQTIAYSVEVSQSQSQSGGIASSDERTTPEQDVRSLDPLGSLGIQDADFSFSETDVIENGEEVFGTFQVDPAGVTSYSYEVEAFRNGNATGDIVQANSNTSTSGDGYFLNWQVDNPDHYNGDEIYYEVRVINSNTGDTADTIESPTIIFQGREQTGFGVEDFDFSFEDGEDLDFNERLSVYFETRRPSWDTGSQYGLRFRVEEYVNGASSGSVVADTESEKGVETVFQGDGTISDPEVDFEATWYLGDETNASVGDDVEYNLVIEQYDNSGTGQVLTSKTVSSETADVVEQTPDEDISLAVLAPTKRLRREADAINDAQINPNDANITGFELILGLQSNAPSASTSSSGSSSDDEDSPVQSLLDSTDSDDLVQSQDLTIDGKSYQVSLQEGDSNFILDFFGDTEDSPLELFTKNSYPEVWKELIEEHYGEKGIDLQVDFDPFKLDFDDQGYDSAETPWIVSQDQQPNQPGAQRQKLFKFETIGDGDYANTDVKVSIRNIRYPSEVPGSEYGEFDVVVREFGDDDRSQTLLESFNGVNLDPDSQNYIAKVIGNRKTVLTETGKLKEQGGEAGVFENRSSYVRVHVHEEVVRANDNDVDGLASFVPWGYQPYQIPLDFDGQIPHGVKPRITQTVNDVDYDILPEKGLNPDISSAGAPFDNRIHFGFDFDFEGNMSFLQAIAENADAASDQQEFDQNFGFVLSDGYVEDPNDDGVRQIQYGDAGAEGFAPSRRKFNVAFQGGFDGQSPAKPEALEENITATNSQGLDLSTDTSPGTVAYKKAISILGNEDQFDINLLVTPGVLNDLHSPVVQAGVDMVESRSDCFYVFDAAGVDASVEDAIASIESVDTSYAATYYPWMRIRDQSRNKQVRVPPSVLIPRVYAFNDQTAAEWYAPAGFERGGVPEAISAVVRLRREDRDELYRNRVNPIAQFPGQGVSVWGQKTLQTRASALDRVNVRRLLIRVKKFIASTSRFLVFEQNVPETRNRFLNIVNPFLDQVKQQNGLYAFRVKMNADNNPPEVVDRNKLIGEIFLQPTRTAEFIELTFNVLPTGAEFEDL